MKFMKTIFDSRVNTSIGVFATANQYLFMYQWAKERGYIPLMDWETIYNFKKRKR